MGCCNNNTRQWRKNNQQKNNSQLDYQECFRLLAEQKDVSSFLKSLCSSTINNNQTAEPGVQCVVVPVLNLCQEIRIFDLSSELLNKIVKCSFVSLFSRMGPEMFSQIYSQYNLFFTISPALDFRTFSDLFRQQLHRLYGIYQSFSSVMDFYKFLTSFKEIIDLAPDNAELTDTYLPIIAYLAKQLFLEEMANEFTKAEFALCQKFLRMEIDLVILMTRLVELATNTQGGISGVTQALTQVALGEANRYFEGDDFNDLFKPAKELADVIIKIAKLYRERFKIFKDVGQSLICSRPQPPVKSPISEIPLVPPTVIV